MRRAAAQPALARRMDKLNGRVALRSTADPQSATIHFHKGDVHVTHGVHPDADVIISADLNTMGQPGAAKPKVSGAAKHLSFALGVAKVLDPPSPGGWSGAVDEFWRWAEGKPGLPDRLRVVCTDDGSERVFGEPVGSGDRTQRAGTTVEVHGPAWALQSVFTGGDHLGAAVLENRVQVVSDFAVLSAFVGVVTKRMLGEP